MMGRGRDVDLTAMQRRTVISTRQAGVTANRIAMQMNISRRTVSRVWRKFIQTGSCARRARSGRPKKTTLREDRMLKRVVQQQRFLSRELFFAINCHEKDS
jgi:transposase